MSRLGALLPGGWDREVGRLASCGCPSPDREGAFCLHLIAADKIDVDDLGEQALTRALAHPHRDQQIVLARRILGEARRPLGGGEGRGQVVGREDGDGAARPSLCALSISRTKLPLKSQSWKKTE